MKKAMEFRVETSSLASDNHPGRNEDAYFARPEGYLGVFDGVGGHEGSEEASQFIASYCLEALRRSPQVIDRVANEYRLRDMFDSARNALIAQAIKDHSGYISTTAIVGQVTYDPYSDKPYIHLPHAGDSRGYVIRNGGIAAVTLDHGIAGPNRDAQEFLSNTRYASDIPEPYRYFVSTRNLISSAISSMPSRLDMRVDCDTHELEPGDIVLLTSDGVHDNLMDHEIVDIMSGGSLRDLTEQARQTARRANDEPYTVDGITRYRHNFRPKFDDITAAVLYVPR